MAGYERNKDREVKFSDVFEEYRFLRESDKVRKNTSDDYGLGRRWVYVCLNRNDFFGAVYGKLKEPFHQEAQQNATCGEYSSAQLKVNRDGRFSLECAARCGIGSVYIAGNVTEIPEELLPHIPNI